MAEGEVGEGKPIETETGQPVQEVSSSVVEQPKPKRFLGIIPIPSFGKKDGGTSTTPVVEQSRADNTAKDNQIVANVDAATAVGSRVPADNKAQADTLQRLEDSGQATAAQSEELAHSQAYDQASKQAGGAPLEEDVLAIKEDIMSGAQTSPTTSETTLDTEKKAA